MKALLRSRNKCRVLPGAESRGPRAYVNGLPAGSVAGGTLFMIAGSDFR